MRNQAEQKLLCFLQKKKRLLCV